MPESTPASIALLRAWRNESPLIIFWIRKTPNPPEREAREQVIRREKPPVGMAVVTVKPKKALSTRNTHAPLSLCRNS
tara:strand:- start:1774 stop:2007 length:234 start_codon:yes stop_codon:yes gene_type:complete